jgi:hypothetical protein
MQGYNISLILTDALGTVVLDFFYVYKWKLEIRTTSEFVNQKICEFKIRKSNK